MATGGVVPAFYANVGKHELSPRSKGIRQGGMLMLSTLLIVPLLAIITEGVFDFGQMLVPLAAVFCFVGGLLRILYALIIQDAYPPMDVASGATYSAPAQFNRSVSNPALPPAPVNSMPWRPRPNTSELAQPPSVTENTTRLLDKDDPNKR